MASGLMLKTYDVRIACEFALTNIDELIEEQRKIHEAFVRREVAPHFRVWDTNSIWWKFFGKRWFSRKLTPDEHEEAVVDYSKNSFASRYDHDRVRIQCIKDMAEYAGDLDKILIDAEDFELLRPNLRGN